MAYNKQTWVDYPNLSSPITADRLNHMEDGIEEAYNHGGGGGGVSVGTILPYSGSTIPNGFMLCDGSAISRTTYAELFSIIGTTYGAGDGSTTFNIPNLKGKVGVGLDSNDTDFDTLGETGGEKTHTLTTQEMPSHTHNAGTDSNGFFAHATGGSNYSAGFVNANGEMGWYRQPSNTGGGQAHNNLQPYVVLNYIIKSSSTSSVEAQIVNEYSTNTTDAYSCNYVNNITKEVYSTNETRVGTWINGKPLYRKVLEINNPSNFSNPYDIDISSLNADWLEIENFQFEYTINNYNYSFSNSGYTSSTDFIRIFRRDNYIRISSGSTQTGATNKKLTFILKYTKTTD